VRSKKDEGGTPRGVERIPPPPASASEEGEGDRNSHRLWHTRILDQARLRRL